MQKLLLILREISDLIIRRSSVENYLKEEILSPVERQELEKTVQSVRHDLLQAAFFRDPLCRPFVMHSLDVILAITRQLHKHQNDLFSGMLAGEPLPVSQQLYEYELECTKLFAWILKTFPDDIEPGQSLSPLFRSENFELNGSFVIYARKILAKRHIPDKLIDISLKPFSIFTGNDQVILYRDFKYVYFYKKTLMKFLRSTKIDTEKVCSFLHCRRNNSKAFLQWQIEHWRESARTNTCQPYDVLYYQGQLRIVCQYPVQLTDHLKDGPGSVELAYNWLKAEVEYFEKKMFFDYAAEQKEQIKKTNQQREKMATVLTVADLACLFRIMVDSELLIAETPAEVMRLVSKTFRTMRVDVISEASLSNKYFTIERATFGKVKSHLVKLLNTLRELESGEKMVAS